MIALAILVSSCKPVQEQQSQYNNSTICPDEFIVANVILSTAVDNDLQPINITNTFQPTIDEIFCSIWVSDDICCKIGIIEWRYMGNTFEKWVGNSVPFPPYVSIKSPEGGFKSGEYQLVVYLGGDELVHEIFFIE